MENEVQVVPTLRFHSFLSFLCLVNMTLSFIVYFYLIGTQSEHFILK